MIWTGSGYDILDVMLCCVLASPGRVEAMGESDLRNLAFVRLCPNAQKMTVTYLSKAPKPNL